MWQMKHAGARTALVVAGLAVLFFGWVSAISAEYPSGPNFSTHIQGDTAVVYTVDEQVQDTEGHPLEVPVFEGSEQEALAYTEQQSEDAGFRVPQTFMIVGAVLVVVAFIPLRKTKQDESGWVDEPA
jgi:hypothetical protein